MSLRLDPVVEVVSIDLAPLLEEFVGLLGDLPVEPRVVDR
jgi:hypothetical protein